MENREYKITKEVSIEDTTEQTIDNNALSLESLLKKVTSLSKDKNPYKVYKEIEEIKSIFYIKLNIANKESNKHIENEGDVNKEIDPLEIKFKDILNSYRKIKYDFRKKKEKEEKKNLETKRQIIEDINKLSKEEESIKITFEKFRILQRKWREIGNVPITESTHIWKSYHHHIEVFYDFIKINNDLRDLDFKRNLEEKNEICSKANILIKEKSINIAHKKLQELHEHWKDIGPVKKSLREETWEKFQDISRKINKKRNDYFLEKKKQDLIKLEDKNAISTKIENLVSEGLDSHHQWQEATKKCNTLELKWKSLGRLRKENNKDAWERLRSSLKKFYNKKNTFYKNKKEHKNQIIEKKLMICKKAEKLKYSNDWQETSKKIIKLQKEWKDSRFHFENKSDEIWKRFRMACDTFFKAQKTYYKSIEEKEELIYKEKKKMIKELMKFEYSSDSDKDIKQLRKVSLKWGKLGNFSNNKMNINDQFLSLLNTKISKIGLDKETLLTEQYKNKTNLFKGDNKAINTEKKIIRNKIDTIKKEITQYENNISFFGKDKSTKPLLQRVQNNINKAKSDIKVLKQKIQLLNKL